MDREHMVRTCRDRIVRCGRMTCPRLVHFRILRSKTVRSRIRTAFTILLPLLIVTICPACSRGTYKGDPRKPYFLEEYQVKTYPGGKASAFGLNIAPAEEMGDWAADWVAGVTDGKGFAYLIYADPDSWDAYLYYPQAQAEIRTLINDDVAVNYIGGTLCVYVTTVPADSEKGIEEDGMAKEDLAESGVAGEDRVKAGVAGEDRVEADAEEDVTRAGMAGEDMTQTEDGITEKDAPGDREERWLLHFAAPPAGAWPSEIELYWDGSQVPCDGVEIKD